MANIGERPHPHTARIPRLRSGQSLAPGKAKAKAKKQILVGRTPASVGMTGREVDGWRGGEHRRSPNGPRLIRREILRLRSGQVWHPEKRRRERKRKQIPRRPDTGLCRDDSAWEGDGLHGGENRANGPTLIRRGSFGCAQDKVLYPEKRRRKARKQNAKRIPRRPNTGLCRDDSAGGEREVRGRGGLDIRIYWRAVIPFLHLGPVLVPTFGLMMAAAMMAAYYVLRADFKRRGLVPENPNAAETFIAGSLPRGDCGARWPVSRRKPRRRGSCCADPVGQLFSRFGLAWFGGLIAGFAAFVWLARRYKIPLLEMLDAGSPAAGLGYGIGRIGCLLSGDGDYGIPTSLPWGMSFPNGLVPTTDRVHPTPIYELIVACAIAWWLWRMGARQVKARRYTGVLRSRPATPEDWERARADVRPPPSSLSQMSRRLNSRWNQILRESGSVFAGYLVLTGAARFLVEFIRINPRSFFGLTNAQAASGASVIAGFVVWWYVGRDRATEARSH